MNCAVGKVVLLELHPLTEPLNSLKFGESGDAELLLRKIGKFNSCFQMTSFSSTDFIMAKLPALGITSSGIAAIFLEGGRSNCLDEKLEQLFSQIVINNAFPNIRKHIRDHQGLSEYATLPAKMLLMP